MLNTDQGAAVQPTWTPTPTRRETEEPTDEPTTASPTDGVTLDPGRAGNDQ